MVKISNSRTLEAVCKVLTSVSAPHELLDAHDIQQKFPGLKSETFGGVFDSRAGILKADRCLLALKVSEIDLVNKRLLLSLLPWQAS